MAKKANKKKKSKAGSEDTFEGKLDITRSGIGYVVVENMETDILVRPNDFNTALHGDKVRVKIVNSSAKSGRMQGQITDVIERKQTEFVGKIEVSKNFAFFIADVNKPMPDIYIPLN